MRPLSRSSAGTLYHQILLGLTGRVEPGEIGVGDRLSSEADLVADFGVSRATARRALDELRRQDLVRREQGKGTFLASPALRPGHGSGPSRGDRSEPLLRRLCAAISRENGRDYVVDVAEDRRLG